jgi:hypothetical protein
MTVWFPLAPGITALPPAPPVVDGLMTVVTLVPVWNITRLVDAQTTTKVEITAYNYALNLSTSLDFVTHTNANIDSLICVAVPAAQISIDAYAPSLQLTGYAANVGFTFIGLAAYAPSISVPVFLYSPPLAVELFANTPDIIAGYFTQVNIPNQTISINVNSPIIAAGNISEEGPTSGVADLYLATQDWAPETWAN